MNSSPTASAAPRAPGVDGQNPSVELAVSTVIFALRAGPNGDPTLWLPLVRRIREPYVGTWALPGGPLHPDRGLAEAAADTLAETTALTPSYLEQLYAFGDPHRSADKDRVVSIVYWALVNPREAERATEDENVHWFNTDELPALAFDHHAIVEYALWRLRNKMEYSRIGLALLGDTFTISQLREVHEAVLQRPIDPANFRRTAAADHDIEPTGEFATGGSHRPARLYRYKTTTALADSGPLRSI